MQRLCHRLITFMLFGGGEGLLCLCLSPFLRFSPFVTVLSRTSYTAARTYVSNQSTATHTSIHVHHKSQSLAQEVAGLHVCLLPKDLSQCSVLHSLLFIVRGRYREWAAKRPSLHRRTCHLSVVAAVASPQPCRATRIAPPCFPLAPPLPHTHVHTCTHTGANRVSLTVTHTTCTMSMTGACRVVLVPPDAVSCKATRSTCAVLEV
jgi:hypothetical protein